MSSKQYLLFLCMAISVQPVWAELSGLITYEYRYFPSEPLNPVQHGDNSSIALQPEFHYQWDNGHQLFSFIPYIREDENDEARNQTDIRELSWLKAADVWELRIGIRKVFWGVTESQHLVDIINQSDLAANTDGEDKLGQPMINLALIGDYGTLDMFVLPYFRERTFPGEQGRFRPPYYVDTEQDANYQSEDKEQHIDYAARWAKSLGVWDIGLSHFYGTGRDPRFTIGTNSKSQPVFIPNYDLIHQTGLDVQATIDSWLLKLEYIHRSSDLESYNASTAGLEYTWYSIFNSPTDLGLVLEYLYDDRDNKATTPFENDVLLGLRFAFNDTQSTDALIGVIKDADKDTTIYSIEASRRLGDAWKLSLEARYYAVESSDTALYNFRDDDYIQMELAYYF